MPKTECEKFDQWLNSDKVKKLLEQAELSLFTSIAFFFLPILPK